jgi:hypothetical protein
MTNHHHRRAPFIAALAAAAATAVTVSVASGQSPPAPTPVGGTTISVTQVDRAFKFVDVAPRGGPGKPFTQGDAFVIGGRLLKGTKVVGKTNLVCTTTQPGRRGGSLCVGALVLPGGQIAFSGYNTVADTPATSFAVTGGTGTYAGARGTLTAKSAKHNRTAITVQL